MALQRRARRAASKESPGRLLRRWGKMSDRLGNKMGLWEPTSRIDVGRTADDQNILDLYRSYADPNSEGYAGRRSQDTADHLALMKGGLGGLTAQENQGLRERAAQEVNRDYATGLYDLARTQSRGGIRGGFAQAAQSDLATDRMMQKRAFENQLMLDNIDVQDRRRTAYGDYLSGVEDSEAERARLALDSWGKANALDNANRLEREKVNLGQEGTDRAARNTGLLGLMSLIQSIRAGNKSHALALKQLEKASQMGGAGGGSVGLEGIMDLINSLYPVPPTEDAA